MAGENEGARTFTEGEAYALVADAVTRETASANAEVVALTASNAALQTERDAMEVRATAAETKAAEAETALTDFKAGIESQKAVEAKRDVRLAQVAEVAPALKLAGERADRLVAMSDEHFAEYVEGLREVAATGPHAFVPDPNKAADCKTCGSTKDANKLHVGVQKAAVTGEIPRESAAFGGGKSGDLPGDKPTASVSGLFAARRAAQSA